MNNITKYITMATIGLTFAFGSDAEVTADVNNEVKPYKKPVVTDKGRVSANINGTPVPQHLPKKIGGDPEGKAFSLKLNRLYKVKTHNAYSLKVGPKRLRAIKRR